MNLVIWAQSQSGRMNFKKNLGINVMNQFGLFGSGGGKKQAEEMNIPFLGAIPINLEARELADNGKSIIIENKEADISIAISNIVIEIEKIFNSRLNDTTK